MTEFHPIDKKMWQASRAFIHHYGPISMHLDSYNTAVTELIPSIIEQKGTFKVKVGEEVHSVAFSNLHFQRPSHKELSEDVIITNPKLCIDRKLSYTASMYVDISYEGPDNQKNLYLKRYIGEFPVMVHSELCNLYPIRNDEERLASIHEDPLDVGGYFIVKGATKVLIPQVRPAHNMVQIYAGKNLSSTDKPKFTLYAETRSGSSNSHTRTTQVGITAKGGFIDVVVPYIDMAAIPIGIMFRALGVKNEQEMVNYIFPPEWFISPPSPLHKKMIMILVRSLERSYECDSQEVALNFIGRRGKRFNTVTDPDVEDEKTAAVSQDSISYARYLLSTEFLSHIGIGEELFKSKCVFLGYMAQKMLMTSVGLSPVSDRDHFASKRIHTPGILLANQFYNAFRQLISRNISKTMEKDIQNKIPINIASYITSPPVITVNLLSALSCNKWGNRGQSQGISQAMDSFNRTAQICFLRKFIIPMSNDGGKIEAPRHIQSSQWGISCPYATPEGKKVGLVQGLAMGAYITVGSDPEPIIQILDDMDVVDMDNADPVDLLRNTRIFVNGIPKGYTRTPIELTKELRALRQNGDLHPEISIAYDRLDREIRISTDAGRSSRAVALAPNGILRLTEEVLDEIAMKDDNWGNDSTSTWLRLLRMGYVEILSKDEEEEMNIAIFPSDLLRMRENDRIKYTHCELTPDLIEGAGVSTSPHNHRNQAPRNIYQEAMSHQAIGVHSNSMFGRKGKWHVMDYPQKPIVSTRISRELGFNTMGMGQNAMVAVMSWYGKNQEDSIIMSKAAIDRGFMNSTTFIAYEATLCMVHASSNGGDRYEAFEIPSPETCNDFKGYSGKLIVENDYVYVPKGTAVKKDDILIGMTVTGTPENSIYTKNKTNISIRYDQKLAGVVHSVQYGFDGDGYRYIRLVVAQKRIPVISDKFAARHGQKGTVGDILPPEEMPIIKRYGYPPDILINPLAFPSRMTIGMLVEALTGVALTSSGLQSPEFTKPLCLDSKDDDKYITSVEKLQNLDYKEGFDPHRDYDTTIDGDGTPWDYSFSLQRIRDAIKKMGLNEFSEEVMINPTTGKEMDCLVFNSVVYYQRLKHMVVDKIHCVDGETEVLTFNGWKNVANVTMSDHVATLVAKTTLEYTKPIDIQHYPKYYGEIYHLLTDEIDLVVTGNHRMWVKKHSFSPANDYDFERADRIIGKDRYYKRNANWDVPDYQFILSGDRKVEMNSWIKLFGIFLTDGIITFDNQIIIDPGSRSLTDVAHLIELQGLDWRYSKGERFHVIDEQLASYFSRIISPLPEWVWHLSRKQCQLLFQSMNDSNCPCKINNDDLQRLALHAGDSYGKRKHVTDITLSASSQSKRKEFIITERRPVYCLTVPSGVFYIRRNGKAIWTGNSRARGTVHALHRQPTEGRKKGGGFRIGVMEKDCMLGQGLPSMTADRMFHQSDEYRLPVCILCGLQSILIKDSTRIECRLCGDVNGVMVPIPYGTKLMNQEFAAMNIVPRIITQK